jgi:hypothetical protein
VSSSIRGGSKGNKVERLILLLAERVYRSFAVAVGEVLDPLSRRPKGILDFL